MRSCDECPGSTACSGQNLYPVLVRVYDLFAAGKADKFDILFALNDEDEAILERHSVNVSRACWTKAALLAIVEVVGRLSTTHKEIDAETMEARVFDTIRVARDAFVHFPWHLDELVDQAPDLYALIQENCPRDDLCENLSKRAFVKVCKSIAYA